MANVTSNYTYDQTYELTQVTRGVSTTESYTYDPVGNRLSSLGVASYSYSNSNELTSTSTSSTSYTYDNNGNTLTKSDSTGNTTYAWDYENRLTSVALPGSGGTVALKYDPFGRRIYKSSTSGTSVFAYDGEDLTEETNVAGRSQARYAHGPLVDEPLVVARSSATSYYEADGLGSVTSLSNGAGALAQTYTFDSFGKRIASSGSLANPFEYTAREWDPETGLYFYRARYFDPGMGRFLTEDPLRFEAGVNFYSYVTNDPVDLYDPLGLKVEVRCRTLGPRGLSDESLWNAIRDGIARYVFGAKHCFLAVSCDGIPLTIISYLGNGVNVVEQGSSQMNNDVSYSNSGNYKAFPVSGPGCCQLENCIVKRAQQLHAEGFRINNYSKIGPNSNSFADRLVLDCGGRVSGNPGQSGAYGWEAPWNITF